MIAGVTGGKALPRDLLLAELVACLNFFWSGRYTSVPSHAARVGGIYNPEAPPRAKSFHGSPGHGGLGS
jgi:hypothetical protein